MTRDRPPTEPPPPSRGDHVTTLSYLGRFWDVFLELESDGRHPELYRAMLCFSPSDMNSGEQPARTGTIIIERSYQEALDKAKSFDQSQLAGLLRSSLPD